MEKTKRVILYCRVSTTEQADHGYSLADQEARLEQYCKRMNYEIAFKVREDFSAKTFDRPKIKIIVDYIKKNKGSVDELIIVKWDRFSRNVTEAYIMIKKLLSYGVRVNAIDQPIDVAVPEQKTLLSLYLTFPEVENDRRSINVIRGMRKANIEGRYLGPAPRGYKNATDDFGKPILLQNEDSKIIKQAFELLETGLYSQQEVLKELTLKGFTCSKSQFSVLLQNKLYIGKVRVRATVDEAEYWVDSLHEKLIDEELFYAVQDYLSGRRAKSKRVKIQQMDENLPLRGILICSHCSAKLTGSASKGNGGRYYYYHCNACAKERFRANRVNEQLAELLGNIQIEPTVKKLYWEIVKDLLQGDGNERKTETRKRDTEITKNQDRINNITDLLADGRMTQSDYSLAKKRINRNSWGADFSKHRY